MPKPIVIDTPVNKPQGNPVYNGGSDYSSSYLPKPIVIDTPVNKPQVNQVPNGNPVYNGGSDYSSSYLPKPIIDSKLDLSQIFSNPAYQDYLTKAIIDSKAKPQGNPVYNGGSTYSGSYLPKPKI